MAAHVALCVAEHNAIQHILGNWLQLKGMGDAASRCSDIEEASPSAPSTSVRSAKYLERPTTLYDVMRESPPSQSLFSAALHGDVKAAMRDLMEHATPNCCNAEGFTPLMIACAGGHIDVAKLLITSAAEVNACPCRLGLTALSLAAAQGNWVLSELLLKQTADVNASCKSSNFPLGRVSAMGHAELCRLLLDHGADIHGYDEEMALTPIMRSIDHEHLGATKLLLQYGAGLAHADHKGRSALTHTVDVLLRMQSYDKMMNLGHCGGAEYAAYNAWAEIVSAMVSKRANLNVIDCNGDSLLCRALRHRREDVVLLLLGMEADANLVVPSLDEGSVLTYTISNGPRELCYRLVARRSSVNQATRAGVTPLHLALDACDEDLCFHLLKYGADPQLWDPRTGETIRMKAAAHGLQRLYCVLETHIPIEATSTKRKYAYPVRE